MSRRSHMGRLSDAQQRFIRAVRDEVKTLEELMREQQISRDQLGRWWGNRYFHIELERAMRLSRKSVKLAVHLAAKVSSRKLDQAFAKPDGGAEPSMPAPGQQSLWRGTIRDDARLARSMRSGGRPKKETSSAPQDLVHASVKHREDELLAILEGNSQ